MVITYAENVTEFNSLRNYSSPTAGCADPRTVENTFRFIVSQIRKGIFVKMHHNRLVNFIVFNVNDNVENAWGDRVRVDPRHFSSIDDFMKHVARKTRAVHSPESMETDPRRWRCNNGIFRFEKPPVDNRKNLECIHDMFVQLAENCVVDDCEFFVNKRDFPIRRRGPFEPFHHIWDSKRAPLKSEVHAEYSPILSQCSEHDFADVAVPTYDDWALVRDREDGVRFEDSRVGTAIEPVPWSAKKNLAVFRGSCTGIGTTIDNNARVKLVRTCEKFPALFDVGFTRINYRPRKQYKNPFLQTIEERFVCVQPLSLQQQAAYKFIINVEGHSAAFRLSSELLSGSCVLLVDSPWQLWIRAHLVPLKHFVPVKSDLSNLVTQMRWCLDNDTLCRDIAERAGRLADTLLSKRGMLEHLKTTLASFGDRRCVYEDRFLFRHDPQASRRRVTDLVVPGVEWSDGGGGGHLSACPESKLLTTLVVWHAHTLFKMTWGHTNILFRTLPKKRCLSFCLAGNWFQMWTSLGVVWPIGDDSSFCVDDLWYGPLTWRPLADLDALGALSADVDALESFANRYGIVFRKDCCVSRVENGLFRTPAFASDNVFLLTYYCVRILSFIPKAAQKSDDPAWKRWQSTLAYVVSFFRNNVDKTSAKPISFQLYSFPHRERKRLRDYTKWNYKIRSVLDHRGPFELSSADRDYYERHFAALFETGADYTFLLASHNTVVSRFENTK